MSEEKKNSQWHNHGHNVIYLQNIIFMEAHFRHIWKKNVFAES